MLQMNATYVDFTPLPAPNEALYSLSAKKCYNWPPNQTRALIPVLLSKYTS